MPVLISEDGRWWWDGRRWQSRTVDGELSLFWFTSTPEWASRILVMGAIGLIPIVGTINLYGWALAATDMIRRNWRELPPGNFSYLERGVKFFVVGLVYGFVVLMFVGADIVLALVLGFSGSSRVPLAIGIGAVGFLLLMVVWLLELYLMGPLLIASDRLGIGPALNPLRLLAIAQANQAACLRIGVTYLVGALALSAVIFVIGVFVPFAGLLSGFAVPVLFALIIPELAKIDVVTQPAA